MLLSSKVGALWVRRDGLPFYQSSVYTLLVMSLCGEISSNKIVLCVGTHGRMKSSSVTKDPIVNASQIAGWLMVLSLLGQHSRKTQHHWFNS